MQGKETGIILLNQDRNVHVINNVFIKLFLKVKIIILHLKKDLVDMGKDSVQMER